MAWGCFSGEKGNGGLYFLGKNAKYNGALYVNCELNDHNMLPFYEGHDSPYFLPRQCFVPQSKNSVRMLSQHRIHSPSLNPVKHAWSHMKKMKLRKHSADLLIEKIRKLLNTLHPLCWRERQRLCQIG